jgi:hypothetical protein
VEKGFEVVGFHEVPISLEEAFVELTGHVPEEEQPAPEAI